MQRRKCRKQLWVLLIIVIYYQCTKWMVSVIKWKLMPMTSKCKTIQILFIFPSPSLYFSTSISNLHDAPTPLPFITHNVWSNCKKGINKCSFLPSQNLNPTQFQNNPKTNQSPPQHKSKTILPQLAPTTPSLPAEPLLSRTGDPPQPSSNLFPTPNHRRLHFCRLLCRWIRKIRIARTCTTTTNQWRIRFRQHLLKTRLHRYSGCMARIRVVDYRRGTRTEEERTTGT